MNKSNKYKIKKYYKSKNFAKIVDIVQINQEAVNLVIYKSKNRNIIHILCRDLVLDILNLVLNDKYDYLMKDKKGNTALHLALKRCIKKNVFVDVLKYWDLFTEKNSLIKTVKNKRGKTPFDYLMLISDSLNKLEFEKNSARETKWMEDLENDAYDDYMQEWGKYEEDYFGTESHIYESHETWTERIAHEYNNKRTSNDQQQKPSNASKPKSSYNSEEDDRVFREKHAKAKSEYLNKYKYESFKHKWMKFESKIRSLQDGDQICYDDIPWLSRSDNILQLISASKFDSKDEIRKELKLLQIVWHPDRFMNRCGAFISQQNQPIILEEVVQISQMINNAISTFDNK